MPRLLEGDDDVSDGSQLQSVVMSVAARHHFGEGWALDAILPTGLARLTTASGTSEGVGGLGDIELAGRYELGALWGVGGYTPSLTLRLGVSLPTGARATTSGAGGTMPTALRIGTGAFGAVGEIRYTQFLDRLVALSIPVSVRGPLTRDGDGRTVGVRVAAGVEGLFFPIEWLLLRVAVQYQHVGQLDEGARGAAVNSGGSWLRAEGLALFRIGDRLSLGAGARGPIYVNVNGRQLTEEWGVTVVAAVTFGAREPEEEEHDHAPHSRPSGSPAEEDGEHRADQHHGDSEPTEHPDPTPPPDDPDSLEPGDVTDVAVGGESFELADVLAEGRITVIDFWADWCHPCEHIDELLRELASRHPELAVRRVEVPSADTPVAEAHLGSETTLPQVWIFDAEGERVDRLVGVGEEQVRERIEELLSRGPPS